jgi:hypothetical protein
VTDHGDQLREAFENHENLAPDPAAVYARVLDLSRTYKRRRRTAQIAGGAVLGAGLLTGGIALPAILGGSPPATVQFAAAPAPSASSALGDHKLTKAEQEKGWAAFFDAGYTYNDAVRLAKAWNTTASIGTIKAEAGQKLLAGETLPVKPDPKNVATAKENAALDAYFAAGYDYDDAVKLAELWHSSDPYRTKVDAGQKLLDGEKLPVKPGTNAPAGPSAAESAAVSAFFDAGYSYEDAVKLADLWKLADPYSAKVAGGKKLEAGETLPIKP